MSSPSRTGSRRLERFEPLPDEPMRHDPPTPEDRLQQEFFVEWEVPVTPVAADADYDGRARLPVDLRGTGALLVGDFDVLAG